jgi:hypothetical protein
MIGAGRCFKKSIILSEVHGLPINSFEYSFPIYEESNQKIEIAIIITAKIKPGIAIPINAMKVSK